MSLRLLLDEDTQANRFIRLLRDAGHDVETATEAGLIHKPDTLVLSYARQNERLVLTRNCAHFHALHMSQVEPSGVLAIFQHNTDSDLSDVQIVQAIATLEKFSREAGWAFETEFIVLNQWHWV